MRKSFITVALTAISLSACGPSFEDQGFASEGEAERLSAMGFPKFSALMKMGAFEMQNKLERM